MIAVGATDQNDERDLGLMSDGKWNSSAGLSIQDTIIRR